MFHLEMSCNWLVKSTLQHFDLFKPFINHLSSCHFGTGLIWLVEWHHSIKWAIHVLYEGMKNDWPKTIGVSVDFDSLSRYGFGSNKKVINWKQSNVKTRVLKCLKRTLVIEMILMGKILKHFIHCSVMDSQGDASSTTKPQENDNSKQSEFSNNETKEKNRFALKIQAV